MKIIRFSLALPYLSDLLTSNSSNPQFSTGHNGGVSVTLATSRSEHWMLRVLVYLVGHRARPSLAWQVALVLATTGSTRRCPAGSTDVGRPAFARDPRILRLTQLQNLRREATTLRLQLHQAVMRKPSLAEHRQTARHEARPTAQHTYLIRMPLQRLDDNSPGAGATEVELHRFFLRQPGRRHKLEDTIGNYLSDHWCKRSNSTSWPLRRSELGDVKT